MLPYKAELQLTEYSLLVEGYLQLVFRNVSFKSLILSALCKCSTHMSLLDYNYMQSILTLILLILVNQILIKTEKLLQLKKCLIFAGTRLSKCLSGVNENLVHFLSSILFTCSVHIKTI